jgi:hypothetical protein
MPYKDPEKIKQYNKEYRIKNKEKVNARARELYVLNRQKILKRRKEWHFKNREKESKRRKKYRSSEKGLKKIKEYYLKNKERIKLYRIKNKEKIRENKRKYAAYRRKTDIHYKIKDSMYARINIALRIGKNKKYTNTMKIIGCSIEELKIYLESKFKPGMSWNNRNKWHIDHIKPCISFDLSKPEEQVKCFHYTNLQPLWAHENLSKGSKVLI